MEHITAHASSEPANGDREGDTAEPVWTIEVGRPQALRLSAYGVLLAFLSVGVFSAVVETGTSPVPSLGMIAAFVLSVVAHELVHALFFRLFGGSPRFGLGVSFPLPFAYTTSEGDRFGTRQMAAILLAPLVLISVVTLAISTFWPTVASYGLVALITNLFGAVGDVWLLAAVLRFSQLHGVSFEDRRTGIAVWVQDPNRPIAAETSPRRANPIQRFITGFLSAALTILMLTPAVGVLVTAVMSSSPPLRIGPTAFPLFEMTTTAEGGSTSIGMGPSIVGGVVFGLVSALSPPRRHSASDTLALEPSTQKEDPQHE